MPDATWELQTVLALQWRLLTMLLIEHAEKAELVDILVNVGVLPEEQYRKAALLARQVALETVRDISGGGADALSEILRKFEGPVH
jgi:hypothetical protein